MPSKPPLTTAQAARRLNISVTYLVDLLGKGRIAGATKFGRAWSIPDPPKIVPAARSQGRPPKK